MLGTDLFEFVPRVLRRTLVEGGYIDAAGNYVFLLPDHLGNVRTVAKADGTRLADYYPYGDTFMSSSVVTGQPYRFGGKELDVFGAYDFSARWYDPNTGGFSRIDPMAVSPENIKNQSRTPSPHDCG